jgi:hypothetical protein
MADSGRARPILDNCSVEPIARVGAQTRMRELTRKRLLKCTRGDLLPKEIPNARSGRARISAASCRPNARTRPAAPNPEG